MKTEKEYLLVPADIGTHWIGGLYYFKNIIFSLLQSVKICSEYRVLIVTTEDCKNVFSVFENRCDIFIHKAKDRIGIQLEYFSIFSKYKVKYIYNAGRILAPIRMGKKGIYWIADFQHVHYPAFFSEDEKRKRNKIYRRIARKGLPLVLSSNDALKDFEEAFHGRKSQVKVVHFVSYIENELKALTPMFEESVLEKQKLEKYQYIYIPNQFWKHKNQLTVLKAVRLLPLEIREKYKFVFSGNINSYKNDEYVHQIKEQMEEESLSSYCKLLGFFGREEQLCIMKNCCFIIQPSLFEGWSTVVEDAKVLNKKIILSDIAVHREQKYEKSVFFNPNDPKELSQRIIETLGLNDYQEDIESGLRRMKKDAKEYSCQLEAIFEGKIG